MSNMQNPPNAPEYPLNYEESLRAMLVGKTVARTGDGLYLSRVRDGNLECSNNGYEWAAVGPDVRWKVSDAAPDPQDPITVTRKDLRECLLLCLWGRGAKGAWQVAHGYTRRIAEALGEWPTDDGEWITLEEARERWGE